MIGDGVTRSSIMWNAARRRRAIEYRRSHRQISIRTRVAVDRLSTSLRFDWIETGRVYSFGANSERFLIAKGRHRQAEPSMSQDKELPHPSSSRNEAEILSFVFSSTCFEQGEPRQSAAMK
jgi:hypothetical protein